MNRGRAKYAAIGATLAAGAGVSAESMTFTDMITAKPTGWTADVALPQFDPSLGDLESVAVNLVGRIEGSVGFESLDAAAAEIRLRFAADLILSGPSTAFDLIVSPTSNWVAPATSFDGVIDLGGPSGGSWLGLTATEAANVVAGTGPVSLRDFIGTGVVPFVVSTVGRSEGSGTGNLALQFEQQSSADIAVTYTYTVPEPTTLAFLGVGVIATTRQRKPTKKPPPTTEN